MKDYIPLIGAYIAGLFSLLGTVWLAGRSARTGQEMEALRAKLAESTALRLERRKQELAHLAAIDLTNRKSKLDRVNLQLKQLYGPLYALANASHRAWLTFRSSHRPGRAYWPVGVQIDEADIVAWRLWMSTVFMPLNLEMERLVLANSDLLVGERMENCLVDLCAHVEAYKTVLERWKSGDYSVHFTPLNFPGEALRNYVASTFGELKREQQRLLTSMYDSRVGDALPDS